MVQMVRTIPELPVPMEVTQVLPALTEMVLVVTILTPMVTDQVLMVQMAPAQPLLQPPLHPKINLPFHQQPVVAVLLLVLLVLVYHNQKMVILARVVQTLHVDLCIPTVAVRIVFALDQVTLHNVLVSRALMLSCELPETHNLL